MKKFARHLLIFFAISLQACADSDSKLKLETSEQRLSYGLAYLTGKDLISRGMRIDAEAYAAGIRHAVANKDPEITEEEIRAEMSSFQEMMHAKQEEEKVVVAEKNEKEGAEFLKNNSKKEGVIVTDTGLQYRGVEGGDGRSPAVEDSGEVHYRGTLLDGTECDSSYARGQTVNFGVTQVIAGWTEALQLMSVGAKWKLFIPSDLAYGPGGAGGMIEPSATLIFDVELISIDKPSSDQ